MKKAMGDDFSLVLDIKQARRSLESPYDFINQLGKHIKHIHISDYNDKSSCIPPTEGLFDFREFFSELSKVGYDGKFIIELYDYSYTDENQIYESFSKISEYLITVLISASAIASVISIVPPETK